MRKVISHRKTMKTISKILILLIACSFTNISCQSDKIPKDIIQEDTMVSILTEIHLADAYFSIMTDEKDKNQENSSEQAYTKILEQYNVSPKDFEKSIDYYTEHPNEFRNIYEKVILQLDNK